MNVLFNIYIYTNIFSHDSLLDMVIVHPRLNSFTSRKRGGTINTAKTKKPKPKPKTTRKDTQKKALPPPWVTGDMEAPAGEKNTGSSVRAVFTKEQQARLGVDEYGNKVNDAKKTSEGGYKDSAKLDYSKIANEIHHNLKQVKLTPIKKRERTMFEDEIMQLLKLPKKEFVAQMKKKLCKEDVRLLLELMNIELQCITHQEKQRSRKRWESMKDDDDALYMELYSELNTLTIGNKLRTRCQIVYSSYQFVLLIWVMLLIPNFLHKFKLNTTFPLLNKITQLYRHSEQWKQVVAAIGVAYLVPTHKYWKEHKMDYITDPSVKTQFQQIKKESQHPRLAVKKQNDIISCVSIARHHDVDDTTFVSSQG